VSLSLEKSLELYEQMYLMRRFEESAAQSYTERKIGGFLHLYIGQEAVAAGVIAATEEKDYIITSYRDHAHYLARGGSPREGMAELFGKKDGCSGGRGGSMHFFDAEKHFMGGWGIVGAHVPLAAGIGFASKYKKDGGVCVCFLGEGAVSIGPFHEGMCLAALWKLPVVFVVENNRYAMGTPIHRTMTTEDVSTRALAYPMARASVDGCDLDESYAQAKIAIDRAREQSMPTLLEYKTYRYRGHSMADPAKYRTKEELEEWKGRDPLNLLRTKLKGKGVEDDVFKKIEDKVELEVKDCKEFAEQSPEPNPETLADFVYI